jgi:DNA modification methylase
MKIETWPIDRPIPYARNARKIPQQAIDKVAGSIKEFGFRQPIVVDKEGVIVAGHTRLLAAQKLGLAEVPVHVASELTATQIKAYRLADNRVNQESSFDNDLLVLELAELKVEDYEFELTGFDPGELCALEALGNFTTEGLTDEDELPPIPELPLTVEGDVWTLGNHRLLCGDSTNTTHIERLMSGQQADLVVTDPPYNVAYQGKTKDALTIQNDRMGDRSFFDFLLKVYSNLLGIVKDGAGIYVFHADTEGLNFRRALVESGFKLAQCCIWVKQAMVMGRQDYHWQHEPVLYGWKPTGSHHWYADRKQTTVWNFNRPMRNGEHPTMKPVALIEYPIRNSSRPGDIVVDPFGGSGSTLLACEQNARSCRTMEIDPKYCDVMLERWANFTGKDPVRQDGVAWSTLKPQRAGKHAVTNNVEEKRAA